MRIVREIEGSADRRLEEAAKRKYATKKIGRTCYKLRLDTKNFLHKLEVEVGGWLKELPRKSPQ